MKEFAIAVIGGVVAMVIWRTMQQNRRYQSAPVQLFGVASSQQQVDPRYTGEPTGVEIFIGTAAPSGHGDATANATGAAVLGASPTVGTDYAPAFGMNENQGDFVTTGLPGWC